MYTYLFAFSIALIFSLLLTPLVREWAKRKGWVDNPDGKRKLHSLPIPRIGGLGLYFAIIAALIPVYFLHTAVAVNLRNNLRTLGLIVAFSGLIMLLGLWDDLKNVSPWKKFLIQSLVALLCWFAGFRILLLSGAQSQLAWAVSLSLTVLWIVGITNAFNLIDGMDGLAAGAALFATLTMLVVSFMGNYPFSALLLAALGGAILGFLRYNFNPASIFLGDSGSLLLGFTLALLSIRCSQKSTAAFSIAIPLVALGLPVIDTGLAIARRFLGGKPIFSGDRRHIHHILIQRGYGPKHAVIVLYGICGLFGLFSLCFLNPMGKTNGVILAILGICILLGIQQLRYSELHALRGHFTRGLQNQRKLLAGSVVVGRIVEQLRKSNDLGDIVYAMRTGLEELCFSRFELVIQDSRIPIPVIKERGWEVLPLAMGGTVLRWTSPCRSCEKLKSANPVFLSQAWPESPCYSCKFIKNPILQKKAMKARDIAESGSEYQIALPLYNDDGSDLGIFKFHYPAGEDLPVSAISVLSHNLGKELEAALRRSENNELLQDRLILNAKQAKRDELVVAPHGFRLG